MLFPDLLGSLSALLSALFFGAGDFLGGYATRRINAFQVLALSSLTGATLLLIFTFLLREPFPSTATIIWATLAGIFGTLGVSALFHGLATEDSAVVAPTAGVIGAALPVIFSALARGLPKPTQMMGFLVAICGIWLVTRSKNSSIGANRRSLTLGLIAGLGFSAFFIFLAQIEDESLLAPLVCAKLASFLLAALVVLAQGKRIPQPGENPLALLSGALDAAANVFYLLATRYTRLDAAVVLCSLYPAVTVMLSRVIVKEQVSAIQWSGIAFCVASIALIAL